MIGNTSNLPLSKTDSHGTGIGSDELPELITGVIAVNREISGAPRMIEVLNDQRA